MPFADVNGQRIYFEDTGGRGAAVIFSHGILMDHEMFEPQVAALSDEFRCITWDERGFGQTEAHGAFTYWDSADDACSHCSPISASTLPSSSECPRADSSQCVRHCVHPTGFRVSG